MASEGRLERVGTRSPAVSDWSEVRAGGTYTSADVAALLVVSELTVNAWARSGKLRALPRMSPRQPFRYLGAEILRLLGDQAATVHPRPAETQTERLRRGQAAVARINDLAAGGSAVSGR